MKRDQAGRFFDQEDFNEEHDTILAEVIAKLKKNDSYLLSIVPHSTWVHAKTEVMLVEESLEGYPPLYPDIVMIVQLTAHHAGRLKPTEYRQQYSDEYHNRCGRVECPRKYEEHTHFQVHLHCPILGCDRTEYKECASEDELKAEMTMQYKWESECQSKLVTGVVIDIKSAMRSWSSVARQMKMYEKRFPWQAWRKADDYSRRHPSSPLLLVVTPDDRWDVVMREVGIIVARPPIIQSTLLGIDIERKGGGG